MTKKDIVKSYIRLKVKQLLERQEAPTLDPKRIGKVDEYTRKLPLLDKALRILLSPQYRHFVKDIQIISPKPSTYKIVLNNDYFLYLKYNRGTVTANIEGKNYSLLTLADAQRASNSVTELLKFTSAALVKKEADGSSNELNSMEGGGFASGGSPNMDGEGAPEDEDGIPNNDGSEVGGTENAKDFDIDSVLGEK